MRSISSKSLMTINITEMKEWRKTYKQHQHKIEQIQTKHKINRKKINQEQDRIAQVLRKSKETAKRFKKQQEDAKRMNQDKRMIQNLIEISKKPRIRSQIKLKLQNIPSRSVSKEKQYSIQQMSQENKRLAKSIVSSVTCVKKYRKKLKTQINQYLKTRTHLQKLKPVDENRQQKQSIKKRKRLNKLELLIQQKTEQIERSKSQMKSKLPEIRLEDQNTTLAEAM